MPLPGLTASCIASVAYSQWSLKNRTENGVLDARKKLRFQRNIAIFFEKKKSLHLQQTVTNFFVSFFPENGSAVASIKFLPQNCSGNPLLLAVFLAAPGIVRQSNPIVVIPSIP